MDEAEMTCRRCRFWVQQPGSETIGTCHRYPMTPFMVHEQAVRKNKLTGETKKEDVVTVRSYSPATESTDFCGEFVPSPSVRDSSPVL